MVQVVHRKHADGAMEFMAENPKSRNPVLVALPLADTLFATQAAVHMSRPMWRKVAAWFKQNPTADEVSVTY